jgi:hypothetical protein
VPALAAVVSSSPLTLAELRQAVDEALAAGYRVVSHVEMGVRFANGRWRSIAGRPLSPVGALILHVQGQQPLPQAELEAARTACRGSMMFVIGVQQGIAQTLDDSCLLDPDGAAYWDGFQVGDSVRHYIDEPDIASAFEAELAEWESGPPTQQDPKGSAWFTPSGSKH